MPRCDCGDALKPEVVLFGELLPEAAMARANALAATADLLLCVGSSLEVYPVAQLPQVTLAAGGSVALITQGPTPLDSRALVKLDGDVVDELSARGVVFESFQLPWLTTVEGIAEIAGNYPSKGSGERGAWFRDSEGNLLGIGQPVK